MNYYIVKGNGHLSNVLVTCLASGFFEIPSEAFAMVVNFFLH